MKMKVILLAAATSLACSAGPACAAAFFTNGTGLASPASTLTFSEIAFPDNTLITNQFAGFGITFNNAVINPQDGFLQRDYIGNFELGAIQYPDLSFVFNSAVSDAAFELVTNPGDSIINIFLGTTLVDTTTFSTDLAAGNFYGYTGGLFDRIQIVAPGNTALILDNIQFNDGDIASAVPEPATWALLLVGFGMAGAAMRARRRKVSVSYA